jgi:2-polyprenyl-3-methyl-5-hydroxy-6-metoxy-1,4-benzoquinol methylase
LKNCISCGDKILKKSPTKSYLNLDIFYCKKCGLYAVGKSEDEVKERICELYEGDFWGSSIENAIDTNFQDVDSQGKRRNWISQYSYCKPFFENRKSIFEIGAGAGHASVWFEEEGFDVTGIEPDSRNVEEINKILNIGKCIVGYVEEINLEKKFDIIWMSHVLEHLIRPDLFLENIKKNLKSDGIFFIEVPNCGNDKTFSDSLLNPHTFHFSKTALSKLVEKMGYEILSYDCFRPSTKFEGLLNKIFRKLNFLYVHYPRIITDEKNGQDLRIILKLKD